CAMHYTGMAAAEVVCTTPVTALPESDSLGMLTALPVLLVMLIVVISFLIALVHMYARRFKT
ncbi:MAG: histidine kinase, partial [Comamonadaceae bacterium]|nr:histidine kinase [Comamonadaceae bacterium]